MLTLPSLGCPIRDALQAQIRHLSSLVSWATVIVAVGVALEGVELIHDAVVWIKKRRIRKKELADLREVAEIFPASERTVKAESVSSDHPGWVKVVGRIGLIAVVIGVVGEWRCGAKLEDAHNAVHGLDMAALTGTQLEAGEANLQAGKANKRAGEFEKDAAQLGKDAEHEKLLRVELEAKVAWRRLSQVDKTLVGSNLRVYKGENAGMSYDADTEGQSFATDIASALVVAKWNISPPQAIFASPIPGFGKPIQPVLTGVGFSSTGDAFSTAAARALYNELQSLGFDVSDEGIGKRIEPNPRAQGVWVRVHGRPEGPQGEAKLRKQAKHK
jgi:hypothetical protein